MLELKDATLTIGGRTLFRGLSLMAHDGQLTLISGAPATGKTALLRVMLGFLPLDSGLVSVDGELLTPLSAPTFRQFMVYLPQRAESREQGATDSTSADTSANTSADASDNTSVNTSVNTSSPVDGLQPVWQLSPFIALQSPHINNPLPLTPASLPPLTPEKRILLLDDPEPELLPTLKTLTDKGLAVIVASQKEEYLSRSDKTVILENV
ncbi:MAG: ABC transporter ATP-binding protein [Prevotella sp.]|nr:ABC transporter ATP-binding protein [Prevotella sp.]